MSARARLARCLATGHDTEAGSAGLLSFHGREIENLHRRRQRHHSREPRRHTRRVGTHRDHRLRRIGERGGSVAPIPSGRVGAGHRRPVPQAGQRARRDPGMRLSQSHAAGRRAQQLRHTRYPEALCAVRCRRGVRQVERDRCIDRFLHSQERQGREARGSCARHPAKRPPGPGTLEAVVHSAGLPACLRTEAQSMSLFFMA
ncbi:hypothetical protein VARIO8X_120451 [Burkholderiales bacterium 8X]|nr:hypothetical protein VARIO8X_120451 [Burkholderiales bacterium 8X]